MGDEGRHHQEFRARRVDGTSADGSILKILSFLFI
jgi:hypothetical protein